MHTPDQAAATAAPLSLDDLCSGLNTRLARQNRQDALDYALRHGPNISEARANAYFLARRLRDPQRSDTMRSMQQRVGEALMLVYQSHQLAMGDPGEATAKMAQAWQSDDMMARLAPLFFLLTQYIRQHEGMHGTPARAVANFDHDPAGALILRATLSELAPQEKELLMEVLTLCVRVCEAHPQRRSDARPAQAG